VGFLRAFRSGSAVMLKRMLAALLLYPMTAGCALDLAALRNCDKSGKAHFDGIPLASRSEHMQAQRFTPADPANCLVYVVREKDWWSGAKVDRTLLILTPEQSKPHLLPAEPFILHTEYRDQAIEIGSNVYGMWELVPKPYLLQAIFKYNYGNAFLQRSLGKKENEIGQVQLDCGPGGLMFFAVGDHDFSHNIYLKEFSEEEGIDYVRNGLRSVGFPELDDKNQSWREDLWYKDCPYEK
jgi:hypothetical protein